MTSLWSPALGAGRSRLGARITFDAWLEIPEDEPGELVDGRLEEEEVPDAIHELAVSWLIAVLRGWLGNTGFVFGSEVKLAISATQGRKADIVVYFPGRTAPPRRGALHDPPDIIVEVVTPTPRDERRDRVEKMADYAAFGASSYWLLDPTLGTFEVFQLDEDGRYLKVLGRTDGPIEDVPECSGLGFDLDALWAELDRLGPDPTDRA